MDATMMVLMVVLRLVLSCSSSSFVVVASVAALRALLLVRSFCWLVVSLLHRIPVSLSLYKF